ncbi:MAG: lipopolysaccharide assembly protein LapA domain-containing protein [Alphaproteobacteria bacterium]
MNASTAKVNIKSSTIFKFLRWLAGFPVVILVILFAVANRQNVAFHWSPVNPPLEMPFCFFVVGALLAGLLFGGIISWLNTSALRRERREQKRRIKSLEAQLKNAANGNTVPAQKDFYALPAPADGSGQGL